MRTPAISRARFPLATLAGLLAVALVACTLPWGGGPTATRTPEEAVAPVEVEAAEGGSVPGPDGSRLDIAPGALSQDAVVSVQGLGAGEPISEWSPLSAASQEFSIDLGDAEQVGEITFTLPLAGTGGGSLQEPPIYYVAWAEPKIGEPNILGARKSGNESPAVNVHTATFPVVGSGNYQLYKIPAAVQAALAERLEPLAVPTYPQWTPDWCSPTALTDLVQYHQGTWPVGGLGSVWGESSNYWLAGKAGQPWNQGQFFHRLLGAGGYTVPADVRQSFSDGNAEVVIWNWEAAIYQEVQIGSGPSAIVIPYFNPAYGEPLYDAFRAYTESYFWGLNGPRRPVAWGSSIVGHSRIMTGSDGTSFFYNDPSSGSLNQSITWEAHRQTVMDSLTSENIEIIDTVVLGAPPRSDDTRRGVLWLRPKSDTSDGSLVLLRGPSHEKISFWQWDGTGTRVNGYYFDDPTGVLPDDSEFDNAFTVEGPDDALQYSFAVKNIGEQEHDFTAVVEVEDENGDYVGVVTQTAWVTLGPGQMQEVAPAGTVPLAELTPGRYTLKFILTQGGVVQDVKYVHFRLASVLSLIGPPEVIEAGPPKFIFSQNANCRSDPGTWAGVVTSLLAGQEAAINGRLADGSWMRVLVPDTSASCWISSSLGEVEGELSDVPVLLAPPSPTPTPTGPPPSPTPTQAPPDNQPPVVTSANFSPGAPTTDDYINFSATASDNVGVARIEIYFTPSGGSGQLVKTCNYLPPKPAPGACTFQGGPYPNGLYVYLVKAFDADGNQGSSWPQNVSVSVVVK